MVSFMLLSIHDRPVPTFKPGIILVSDLVPASSWQVWPCVPKPSRRRRREEPPSSRGRAAAGRGGRARGRGRGRGRAQGLGSDARSSQEPVAGCLAVADGSADGEEEPAERDEALGENSADGTEGSDSVASSASSSVNSDWAY